MDHQPSQPADGRRYAVRARLALNHTSSLLNRRQLKSRLIVHWRESHPYDALWIVRGLNPTGEYYGELVASSLPNCHNATEKAGTGFTGTLSQSEADTVFQAAASIDPHATPSSGDTRLGLLAKGLYSNPKLIYEHFSIAETVPSAQMFRVVIDTFKPYFEAHLNELLAAVRHPSWAHPNQDDSG